MKDELLSPTLKETTLITRNCPICEKAPTVRGGAYKLVCCDECYDGAPDSGPQMLGTSSRSLDEAVKDWNNQVEDSDQ